jgi:hypothetical protein
MLEKPYRTSGQYWSFTGVYKRLYVGYICTRRATQLRMNDGQAASKSAQTTFLYREVHETGCVEAIGNGCGRVGSGRKSLLLKGKNPNQWHMIVNFLSVPYYFEKHDDYISLPAVYVEVKGTAVYETGLLIIGFSLFHLFYCNCNLVLSR